MKQRSLVLLAALGLLLTAQPGMAHSIKGLAQHAEEPVDFSLDSRDASSLGEAVGGKKPRLNVAAKLYLPDVATPAKPVPAVIVLHGAGGVTVEREIALSKKLGEMGWASLVIDSQGSRGGQAAVPVGPGAFLADAEAGLKALSSYPFVDPARIALLGFATGGLAARLATDPRIQKGVGLGQEGRRIAAHADLDGVCDGLAVAAQAPLFLAKGASQPMPCDSLAKLLDLLGAKQGPSWPALMGQGEPAALDFLKSHLTGKP
jgi:hypothetical protein